MHAKLRNNSTKKKLEIRMKMKYSLVAMDISVSFFMQLIWSIWELNVL